MELDTVITVLWCLVLSLYFPFIRDSRFVCFLFDNLLFASFWVLSTATFMVLQSTLSVLASMSSLLLSCSGCNTFFVRQWSFIDSLTKASLGRLEILSVRKLVRASLTIISFGTTLCCLTLYRKVRWLPSFASFSNSCHEILDDGLVWDFVTANNPNINPNNNYNYMQNTLNRIF